MIVIVIIVIVVVIIIIIIIIILSLWLLFVIITVVVIIVTVDVIITFINDNITVMVITVVIVILRDKGYSRPDPYHDRQDTLLALSMHLGMYVMAIIRLAFGIYVKDIWNEQLPTPRSLGYPFINFYFITCKGTSITHVLGKFCSLACFSDMNVSIIYGCNFHFRTFTFIDYLAMIISKFGRKVHISTKHGRLDLIYSKLHDSCVPSQITRHNGLIYFIYHLILRDIFDY